MGMDIRLKSHLVFSTQPQTHIVLAFLSCTLQSRLGPDESPERNITVNERRKQLNIKNMHSDKHISYQKLVIF